MIKPLRNYVLIELLNEEEKEQGGVYIPEKTEERQAKGKVIVVGKTGEVKVSDIVWFKRFAGEKVKDEGKEYLLVPYSEILGKVV